MVVVFVLGDWVLGGGSSPPARSGPHPLPPLLGGEGGVTGVIFMIISDITVNHFCFHFVNCGNF